MAKGAQAGANSGPADAGADDPRFETLESSLEILLSPTFEKDMLPGGGAGARWGGRVGGKRVGACEMDEGG